MPCASRRDRQWPGFPGSASLRPGSTSSRAFDVSRASPFETPHHVSSLCAHSYRELSREARRLVASKLSTYTHGKKDLEAQNEEGRHTPGRGALSEAADRPTWAMIPIPGRHPKTWAESRFRDGPATCRDGRDQDFIDVGRRANLTANLAGTAKSTCKLPAVLLLLPPPLPSLTAYNSSRLTLC